MNLFGKILQLLLKIPALQNIRILFYFYDAVVLGSIPKVVKNTEKKNVLVVFPYSLGDAVMFYGALKHLRQIYPSWEYSLNLVCHYEYKQLFLPFFDEILTVDYRKSSVNPFYRAKMLKKFRQNYYDIAVDPAGTEECSPNIFTMNAVCAGEKIGVLSAQIKPYQCPKWLRNKIYSRIIYLNEMNIHKVRYYTEILSVLGNRKYVPQLADLPVEKKMELPKHYAVVFPSASSMTKCWPVECFAYIAKKIHQVMQVPIVICGTEHDREIQEKFKQLVNDIPIIDFLDNTSVLEIIELVGRADLVVTNDTSVYHIAVATGRKTCVVSGEYVYDAFLDYYADGLVEKERVRIMTHPRECRNCTNRCIYKFDKVYPCVEENTVEEVWEAVESLIFWK